MFKTILQYKYFNSTEKYGINTRKLKKRHIDTPFPNEIYSFGCTLRCRLLCSERQ